MAYDEFYMTGESGSNNLNAGSTSADAGGAGAASVTSVNGDWGNAAANRFTAASGTPFSAVNVGEWASIYLDAATAVVYIGKVTAVNAGGASIDLSATVKLGTAPTSGATGRSCKIGGAWQNANAFTGSLLAAGTLGTSMRFNVKAGIYANTSTSRSFSCNGTSQYHFWLRGYKTTPGDMDDDAAHGTFASGTEIPAFTFTTAAFTFTSSFAKISNIDIQGARAGAQLVHGINKVLRCRVENTNAIAAGRAASGTGSGAIIERCWFKATTTATSCYNVGASVHLYDTVMVGGVVCSDAGSFNIHYDNCYFLAPAGDGLSIATTGNVRCSVDSCTFYGIPGDAIEYTAIANWMLYARNCIFSEITGVAVKNSTGTDTSNIWIINPLYHNVNSGGATTSGITDAPTIGVLTDGSSPFVNAAGGDFRLLATSNAKGTGGPTLFENMIFGSSPDRGASQRQEAASGGVSGARIFTGF